MSTATVTQLHVERTFEAPTPQLLGALKAHQIITKSAHQQNAGTVPVIETVAFYFEGDALFLASTDRYRLLLTAHGTTVDAFAGDQSPLIVGLEEVAEFVTFLSRKQANETTTISMTDTSTLLKNGGREYRLPTGVPGDFPKIKPLIPTEGPVAPIERMGFSTQYLADAHNVAKLLMDKNEKQFMLRFGLSAQKPVVFEPATADKQWLYLLMPVRVAS